MASGQAVTKVNAEVAPKVQKSEGRDFNWMVKAAWIPEKLADTGIPLQRGWSDGMIARTHHATGEALAAPDEKSPEQGRSYNRQTGKWTEGGRVAEGPVVATMRGNARGAKRPCSWYSFFQQGEAGEQ